MDLELSPTPLFRDSISVCCRPTQLLAMVLAAYIISVLLSSRWLVRNKAESVDHGHICYSVSQLASSSANYLRTLSSFVGTVVLMTVQNTNKGTGLLPRALFLGCTNLEHEHDNSQRGRPNQEDGRGSYEFHGLLEMPSALRSSFLGASHAT